MALDPKLIKQLREETGASMMDIKLALDDAKGDREKAKAILHQKGISRADKKAGRATAEGRIGCYIHSNHKVAALVELTCETDFVAKNEEFNELLHDLCLQVVGAAPEVLGKDDLPKDLVAQEKARFADEVKGKPPEIADKILEGKLEKNLYSQKCLLHQMFVNEGKFKGSVADMIKAKIGKLGENIIVRRFIRFELGG